MRFWILLIVFTVTGSLFAVELDGIKDFIRIKWKTEMPRPVFAVSFKIKVNADDLRVPKGKSEHTSVGFEMSSNPFEFNGFREFKLFFVALANPVKSYAGFQMIAFHDGKIEKIRYNTAWRSVGGSVPTDELVTVVISFNGMMLDAYVNNTNLANVEKKQILPLGESAGEYSLCFGANRNGRYALKCEIQDVAIYDKALSPIEVQALLDGNSPAKMSGAIAYLPLKNDLADRLQSSDIQIKISPKVKKQLRK